MAGCDDAMLLLALQNRIVTNDEDCQEESRM